MNVDKPKTVGAFPNRTWPWRVEDDACPEAQAERIKRIPVPPGYKGYPLMVNGDGTPMEHGPRSGLPNGVSKP